MKNPKMQEEVRDLYAEMRERIKEMREYGTTYSKLAAASGMTERWFKRFMQGIMPDPSYSEVVAVCKAINFKIQVNQRAIPVKPIQVE
jgi:DNA-binding phage protein